MFKDLSEVIRTIKKECGMEIFSDSEKLRNAYYDFGTSLDDKVTFMFKLFLDCKGSEIIMDAYKKHENINTAFQKVEVSMNHVLMDSEKNVHAFFNAVYKGMFSQKSVPVEKNIEKSVQPEIKNIPEVKKDMNSVIHEKNKSNQSASVSNFSNTAGIKQQTKKPNKKIILGIVVIVLIISLVGFGIRYKSNKYSKYLPLDEKEYLLYTSEIGDEVFWGTYEQDNDIENGKEDIEWIVLDKKGGKAFVVSKYALDSKPYNENDESITWEDCTLRTWLNNDFMNEAFSSEEEGMISAVTVRDDENSENDMKDKIFLLSIQEVNEYFLSEDQRESKPTKYAINNGIDEHGGKCWWWLRSPGKDQNYAANVNRDGNIYEYGSIVHYGNLGVRPAMWINVE